MKNSCVKWIGEIPDDWSVMSVKHFFNIERGRVISVFELCDDGEFPVYSSQTENNGCFGYLKTYDYSGPAITWTTDGAKAGAVFYREGKYNCTNVCGILTFKNDNEKTCNIKFMTYAIGMVAEQNKRKDINGYKIMSNEMAKIKFAVPPLLVQKAIATFLDKKCSEIDGLYSDIEKQIDVLEEYKKSIITEAVTKGLNPDVEMKDSGIEWISMIPKHYEIKPLKYLVDYNASSLPENTTPYYEFDYIDISSVTYGKGIEQFQRMCFKDAPSRARRIVHKNDVILSTVRTYLKATAEIPENELPIIVSTGFITLTANALIDPQYLKYIVQLDAFVSEVESRSTGVSYPAINASEVVKIKIILPPPNEQREVANYLNNKCSEIDAVIEDEKAKLETLTEYKKSLIYEYVTGKKEV